MAVIDFKNPDWYEEEDINIFREAVHGFYAREMAPHSESFRKNKVVDRKYWNMAGEMGLLNCAIPEEYGGGGGDYRHEMIIMEELVKANVDGFGLSLHNAIVAPYILHFGTEEQKQKWLPRMASGELVGAIAMSEPGTGSDLQNVKTNAKKDGNGWVINGSKTFITGGMESDYFVIGARTGGQGLAGISLFFVEKDSPGFSRAPLSKKMGWWASNQASLFFDDCRVPATNLMGQEDYGFIAIMNNFNNERLTLIAGCLGMMKAAYEDSIEWAKQRETFGKPLIKHQVIRHKIADMSAKIDAVESYMNMICWNMEQGETPIAELSKAKFFSTKALEFVASEAMQILGGAGYLRGNRVECIYREVKVMAIGGGSEEIMRDLAVRQMGL